MTAATVTAKAVDRSLRAKGRDWGGLVFEGLLLLSLLFSLAVLVALVGDQLSRAMPVFTGRGIDFLTSPVSSNPARAGISQGLVGSFLIALLVAILAFPIGIMAAIYLEEYAPNNRLTRLVSLNIRNLAGVPSIVYGLLGLSVYVAAFSALGFPNNGRNIIAGALALASLVLPIVIITASEAIRAVPGAIREAGYGVGASRWEVVSRLVLPSATSGILTGTILSISRALGETAPLLLAGAVLGTFSSRGGVDALLTGPYTVLPMIVYDWARKPQDEFRQLTAAGIIVLLVVTLLANAIAILLRNRYQQKW
jgi:phosphate transport system permease protein